MTTVEYLTGWLMKSIQPHWEVTSASSRPSGHVQLDREHFDPVIVAPVSVQQLQIHHVDRILDADDATIICVVPKMSHYLWEAREHAIERRSTTHTMKELYASLSYEDPRSFLDSNVTYAVDRLEHHDMVTEIHMVCESSMEIVREGRLSPVQLAIEYEYEFSEEALVKALKRHPDVDAILNANPNGTPTRAALRYAKAANVGLFKLGELMGALRHGGDSFFNYQPLKERRS